MPTPFWPRRRSNKNLSSQTGQSKKSRQRSKLEVGLERLEERWVLAAFTPGNIAVLDLAAASTNTTGSILELSPAASQASPVQTISIASTGPNAIRFSDSGTSSFLSDTNDQSLLAFSAYNTTTSSGNLASLNPRAVGTLNSSGAFNLATTYNVSSAGLTAGNQTRSATSLDDTNWFITDKGGLYTNGATTPSLTTNILDARSFGGTVYVSSTKTTPAVSTASSPTATSLTGLPGLAGDGSIQDFYLIQSGSNGSTYDVLYTLDQSSSSATINKFSLVGGKWVANGSSTFSANAEAMIAENDGGGGAYLFVTTTSGTANNSLVRLTDSAGWINSTSATTGFTLSNSTTLYTDASNDLLKGLDFVPASPTTPTVSNPTSANIGTNSATLGGTVTGTGSPSPVTYGIVYSLTSANSDPTIGGTGVTQIVGSGTAAFSPFTVSATGLQGTSEYSFAAYAINSTGTAYSSVATFSTQNANPPVIDTPTSTAITNSSATLGGKVESDGGATIAKTGVVYALTSVNSNPQVGGNGVTEVDTASPVDNGAFTVSAAGLSAGSSYTFEAFATNSSGTTYTSATSFTTLAAPTVIAPTFAAVTSSSAMLSANVASDGGSMVTKRGVVYAPTSLDSNPQLNDGTAIETDATGTTGVFTVPVNMLSPATSYTFEAFATNAIGTTYTPATSFTTAAPGVIAAWTFPGTAGAPDNSPAPTYGTGTATTLGMTNNYTNATGTGNTASDDVLSTSGTANANFTENLWRVRGTPNNGWALAAPQYSQGIELDTSTVGYSNIVFSFDWYSTTQGIRDLQVQYNTGSGWVNYQGPSPAGTFVATSNDYYNSGLSPVSPTIRIDLSGVAAANNNPDLGIRLVSAYDSTGTLGNEYASAASAPADVVPYNNSSGNWRFGNLTFSAGTTTTTAVTANPPVGQSPNQPVTFTATVTPASGAQYPSGTVAFYDGNNQIGTTQTVSQVGTSNVGTASITLTTLSPGVHGDITAQYTPAVGDGLIASGSSMNLVAGDPTDNPISYTINAPQATGVDVSPVGGQAFTGVVATFSDGTYTDPTGFSASITWGDGNTSTGVIAFAGTKNETNINGQIVPVSLFTVTGTNTYAATGSFPMSITIKDPNNNPAAVNPTARVAKAPLAVTPMPITNVVAGTPLNNVTVATFTDPGLVANLAALGISDPTTQFSASIGWGDNTTSAGSITYNSGTQTFSVIGSHTYTQTGSDSISVAVAPNTLAVERIDSSDPTNLNVVGDENSDGLTDSPSPDFIDQFVVGAPNQSGPLYTTGLPSVATTGGNEALTNSSYSISEGELTLSTNGQYLVTGGYNDTVSTWAPQQTFSPASVINRVIGTVDGQGNINTTTALTDAYSGDNFRGVVSTDGTQFWTSGHAGDNSDFVHYAALGAGTSTILTGPSGASDINTVEIFNGQLYEGVRKVAAGAPAGIYQIGTGLPTTAGQPQTMFLQVPQSNPLDITSSSKPMSPFGFYMADLNDGNATINGVNVAYVADAEMGIARYDYSQTVGETSPQWNFSYYIDSTGSFKDSVYTVNSDGSVTPTASFNATNPIPASNPNADPTKVGGVRELTGRVITVNGQQEVQLFGVSGFGTDSQPHPGGSLVEVTDPASLTVPSTGLNTTDSLVTLATNPTTDPSELTGVAFSPTAIVTGNAQVSAANPSITSMASAAVTLGTTAPTLSDSAVLAAGYNEMGHLVFTLTGPNGFSYTQTVPVSGNGTYTASDTLPTTGTVAGTYTWTVSYAGDANNNSAADQGGTVEQTVVSAGNPTITATPGGTAVVGTGVPLSVSATLSGGYAETGTITFTLYNPSNVSVYTDTVTVTGDGSYDTSSGITTGSAVPTVAGTYQWVASYSGDANNTAVSTVKGAAPEVAVGPGATLVGTSLYLVGGNTNDELDIDPAGPSKTGSTGIQVQGNLNGINLHNVIYSPAPAMIYIVGFNGNDNINEAATLNVPINVSEGNGNDNVQLGNGNNTVVAGNGNDNVRAGNGNNSVTLGKGNDNVTLGDGANSVMAGDGNDRVQLGDGNNTVVAGNGNDNVRLGNGNNTVMIGAGNDDVQAGDGNNDITLGGGGNVRVGDGNNVIVGGPGNNNIQAGNGDNLIVGGLGHDTIRAGNGNNILIDGSVSQSLAALETVLAEWMADIADGQSATQIDGELASSLTVNFNTTNANTLHAGNKLDWFWAAYPKDNVNAKPGDLISPK